MEIAKPSSGCGREIAYTVIMGSLRFCQAAYGPPPRISHIHGKHLPKQKSPVTGRRNTTVKQDLIDIGRMAIGFSKTDLSGRGGRQRRQAIEDVVDGAQTGRKR
jgi:hypothetical protein